MDVAIEKLRGVVWEPLDASFRPHFWRRNGEIVPAPINPPSHTSDANALSVAERELGLDTDTELRIRWVTALRDVVGRRCPRNKIGTPLVSDIDLLMAYPIERAEALLRAKKVWKEVARES
jgi:hypothetical protein